jgi:hypothetical protein
MCAASTSPILFLYALLHSILVLQASNEFWFCREAFEQEGAVIAALAKIDPDQLTLSKERLEQQAGKSDQIQIVVAEGLEIVVPMAGLILHFRLRNHSPKTRLG